MFSFSLKFSLYICSEFLWEEPGMELYLSFTTDSKRLLPKMKRYDWKEGREIISLIEMDSIKGGNDSEREDRPLKTNFTALPRPSSTVDRAFWSSWFPQRRIEGFCFGFLF